MNPVGSDLQVNIPLTLVSTAFIQGANDFIADRVFPIIGVEKKSSNYYTWDRSQWYRSEADVRAPATESKGSGFTISSNPLYNCLVYAFHKDLDKQTLSEQNANGLFNLESVATRFVTRQLLLKREQIWQTSFFKTGIWTTNLAGVPGAPGASQVRQWNDAASTPIDDVTLQAENMAELTGLRPNTLVIPPRVLRALRRNPQVLDALQGTSFPRFIEQGAFAGRLAEVFDVERVIVPRTIVNTAAEGAADVYTPLYPKQALLVHAATEADLNNPSGGYIFSWTGYEGAGFAGNGIYNFDLPQIRSTRIEGEMAFDQKLIAPDLGVFIDTVIA